MHKQGRVSQAATKIEHRGVFVEQAAGLQRRLSSRRVFLRTQRHARSTAVMAA